MDEQRFDAWSTWVGAALESRRGFVQALALGAAGVATLVPGGPTSIVEAKKNKKKKKKRCKKTLVTCSGNKKCCSKICCSDVGATSRFCVPKGGTCCPAGGGCPPEAPVCCDPAIGPRSCTTATFPVCCFANSEVPYDYGCPAGAVCCSTAGSMGCCAPGAARTRDDGVVGNQRLSGVLGEE